MDEKINALYAKFSSFKENPMLTMSDDIRKQLVSAFANDDTPEKHDIPHHVPSALKFPRIEEEDIEFSWKLKAEGTWTIEFLHMYMENGEVQFYDEKEIYNETVDFAGQEWEHVPVDERIMHMNGIIHVSSREYTLHLFRFARENGALVFMRGLDADAKSIWSWQQEMRQCNLLVLETGYGMRKTQGCNVCGKKEESTVYGKWLPTRLLDLKKGQVIKTTDLCTDCRINCGSYIAVSHVWNEESNDITDVGSIMHFEGVTWKIDGNTGWKLNLIGEESQYRGESRWVWMDTVTVNQDDPDDVARCIYEMPNVYRYARKALVPMGQIRPQDWIIAHTFANVLRIIVRTGTANDSNLQEFKNNGILDHPWFSRVWTLQETLLAPETEVITKWGTWSFSLCRQRYLYAKKRVSKLNLDGMIPPSLGSLLQWTFREGSPTLSELLEFNADRKYTRHINDKIYSVMGLAPCPSVKINYGVSYSETLLCALKERYNKYGEVDWISCMGVQDLGIVPGKLLWRGIYGENVLNEIHGNTVSMKRVGNIVEDEVPPSTEIHTDTLLKAVLDLEEKIGKMALSCIYDIGAPGEYNMFDDLPQAFTIEILDPDLAAYIRSKDVAKSDMTKIGEIVKLSSETVGICKAEVFGKVCGATVIGQYGPNTVLFDCGLKIAPKSCILLGCERDNKEKWHKTCVAYVRIKDVHNTEVYTELENIEITRPEKTGEKTTDRFNL